MIILPLGSEGLDTSPALHLMKELTAAAPACPVVLLSDRINQADIVSAFRANAMGYVPSSLSPDTALEALSLILHGGHYYPADIL